MTFSQSEIAKIINDCEILILPDDSTIEDAITSENSNSLLSKSLTSELEKTEEDFEQIFQRSKLNKHRLPVSSKIPLLFY